MIFAFAGLLHALYFTLAYYGRVKRARWVPAALCAGDGTSCAAVVRTRHARVFGIPNSLLGAAYYLALTVWILAGGGSPTFATGGTWLHRTAWLLVGASAGTVVLGLYLIHALWRVLRVHCPLCYATHAINVVLLILLVAVVW
jgi:uncharacterized membrane protein